MKTGAILSAAVALSAIVGLGFVFVQNASPYLTVDQLTETSEGVHVVGTIKPGSLKQEAMKRDLSFMLEDKTGTLPVHYVGPPQSSLAQARQIVVIGSMKNGVFESEKMLVKCSSKYESEAKAADKA